MSFTSTPNPDIRIGRVAFHVDRPLDEGRSHTIPRPLPNRTFFMVCAGRPGSGKTTLVVNLLTKRGKLYNRIFDWVFLVSPSTGSLESDPFGTLPESHRWSTFEPSTCDEVDAMLAELPTAETKLLILDDVMASFKDSAYVQKAFLRWTANRRHLRLSIIATTQVYNKIPRPVRAQISHVALYPTANRSELDTLYKELEIMERTRFGELMRWVFSHGKHSFAFVNLDSPKVYRMFDEIRMPCAAGPAEGAAAPV